MLNERKMPLVSGLWNNYFMLWTREEMGVLLTNKKLFIQLGLWFFGVAKAKVFGFFKQDENGQHINGNSPVIFLIFSHSLLFLLSLHLLFLKRLSFSQSAPFSHSVPPLWIFQFLSRLPSFLCPSLSISLFLLAFSFRLSLVPAGLSWWCAQLGVTCVFINAVHGRGWTTTRRQRRSVWLQLCPDRDT